MLNFILCYLNGVICKRILPNRHIYYFIPIDTKLNYFVWFFFFRVVKINIWNQWLNFNMMIINNFFFIHFPFCKWLATFVVILLIFVYNAILQWTFESNLIQFEICFCIDLFFFHISATYLKLLLLIVVQVRVVMNVNAPNVDWLGHCRFKFSLIFANVVAIWWECLECVLFVVWYIILNHNG